MMHSKKLSPLKSVICALFIITTLIRCDKEVALAVSSPDMEKSVKVSLESNSGEKGIYFTITYGDQTIVKSSKLELDSKEINFNSAFSLVKVEETDISNSWSSNFSELSTIPDNYNELKVFLKSEDALLNIICRAYNEGVAIAYEVPEQHEIEAISLDEEIHYNFTADHQVWSTPKRKPKTLTAQGEYRKIPLTELEVGIERPLLIEVSDSIKVALAEAKLVDYARLSYNAGTSSEFSILSSLDGKMNRQRQDTITGAILSERMKGPKVHKSLPFQSPWRVVLMGDSYGKLLENNFIIQNLNDPVAIKTDWIKPGKVLRETTLTTDGAFAAIDFVASHNMQYIMFDAGWYGNEMDNNSDATTVTLDPKRSKGPLDLEAVSSYAKEKDIGVILYINRRALEKQLDEVLPLLKEWGIAGIKYGFVRVGDQDATSWLHEAIKKTAEYELIIDVHDEYRPTGFSRTYPNFLTQEGIAGDETSVSNEHTLISMFTRCLAGASDNTVCYYNSRVEKMGSHASQLAKTVCIFSPLQFLYWYDKAPGAPVKLDGLWGDTKHIGVEPELEFFNNVPTTWDETKVLHGQIGKLGVIARRKGEDWFIGGINGKEANAVKIDFSFLSDDIEYSAKLYTDDETVKTRTRVRIEEKLMSNQSSLEIDVKANNGFAIHLSPKKSL